MTIVASCLSNSNEYSTFLIFKLSHDLFSTNFDHDCTFRFTDKASAMSWMKWRLNCYSVLQVFDVSLRVLDLIMNDVSGRMYFTSCTIILVSSIRIINNLRLTLRELYRN